MTTTSTLAPTTDPTLAPASGPGRIRLVAAALAGAALTMAALLVTTPWGERLDSSADDIVSYDNLLEVRDAAWTGMLLDAFSFAVVGLTLALATCHLVRTRGRVAALVGGVLTTAGGVLFAMGASAFATFTWFAAGQPEAAGRSLVAHANDHPGHLIGTAMAGFAVYTLGLLVLAAALVRARAVPLPGVLVFLALVISQFFPIPGRAIDLVQIVMLLLITAYAALVWRHAR